MTYRYADGDPLEQRQSYMYARYEGAAFVDGWRAQRQAVLALLPAPRQAPAPSPAASGGTAALLEALLASLAAAEAPPETLNRLIQRFEVTKRLHHAYTEAWRAADPARYDDLALYIRFGEVLDAACQRWPRLDILNALLKLMDTLTALRERLTADQSGRLASLIRSEARHVDALQQRVAARHA